MKDNKKLALEIRKKLEILKDRANRPPVEKEIRLNVVPKVDEEVKDAVGELKQELSSKLDKLEASLKEVTQSVKGIQIPTPPSKVSVANPQDFPVPTSVRVENLSEIPRVKIPEVKIPEVDLSKLKDIEKLLKEISDKAVPLQLSKDPKDPIAVRLSDGKKFYEVLQQFITQGGGSVPTITSTTTPSVRAVPVVNPDGTNISGGSGSGNGSILDGVDANIKATVFDYTNSNPLAVRLTDTSGDYVGAGAGTQYTEDAAAAANPTGTMAMAVRADTLAAITDTDGDNLALRSTNKGELYVKQTDAVPASQSGTWNVTNISGTVSLPTGAATAAKQDTGNTSLATVAGAVSGTEMQVDVLTMPSVAVTNAGTFAVQVDGAALTSLQLADDVVATLGTTTYTEASTKGTTIGAVRRDADTTLVDTTNEIGPLQMDANGRLKVEVFSGETLPVSLTSTTITGTVAVTQSGTWDEVGINDSGNSITVDGTVTANLAAGTNNIGDVDVLSIAAGDNNIGNVDIVSGTITTVSSLGNSTTGPQKAEDVASANGDVGIPAMAVQKATPANTATTDGDYEFLQMSAGRLWTSATIDAALPAGTNAIGKLAANSGVDIGDVDVTSVVPGTGATNLGKAEDTGHTTGDVGVMALGVRSAAPSERSAGPTDGDYEPFATNEVGAIWVTPTPSANGGASTMNASSSDGGTALTSTAQVIKASAGNLKGWFIYNPNSSAQFVQFYNTAAASVTVGTTNPLFMLTIPATSAANLWINDGIAFSTAMSWSATSTAGGNGAPSTALDAVCWYK